MDANEKKQARAYIGKHIDVSKARLTDNEAVELREFIDRYDDYRGTTRTQTTEDDGWSSDGKYTYRRTFTHTFTDDIGIREDFEYSDDDGGHSKKTKEIKDARGILNFLHENRPWK